MILKQAYFSQNTIEVARDLLGKHLCVQNACGDYFSGMIAEAEAYRGFDDDACHAHKGKTPRCEVMYGSPGHAYVYFTYGLHYMLNLVTEKEDFPAAVLIRRIIPDDGLKKMSLNRYKKPYGKLSDLQRKNLTNGPAKLTQAMRITRNLFNGLVLRPPFEDKANRDNPEKKRQEQGLLMDTSLNIRQDNPREYWSFQKHPYIWVEDRGVKISNSSIQVVPRIGIDYAVKSKLNPWRFVLMDDF